MKGRHFTPPCPGKWVGKGGANRPQKIVNASGSRVGGSVLREGHRDEAMRKFVERVLERSRRRR